MDDPHVTLTTRDCTRLLALMVDYGVYLHMVENGHTDDRPNKERTMADILEILKMGASDEQPAVSR